MSFESGEAGIILGGIQNHPEGVNEIVDFYKEIDNPTKAQVLTGINAVKKLGFVIGAKVKLPHDSEIGVVVSFNKANRGLYNGLCYPINVKFERGMFPYGADNLVLC